jgi:hypothetical protein
MRREYSKYAYYFANLTMDSKAAARYNQETEELVKQTFQAAEHLLENDIMIIVDGDPRVYTLPKTL